MPEDELVVARRRFLHPRDLTAARATARADLAALGRTGAAVAAIDTAPLPDAAALPDRCSRGPATRANISAWPVRATPGIASALGLQVVAGTGPRRRERRPRSRRRDAGAADRDRRRAGSSGRPATRVGQGPSTAAPSGAAAWPAWCGTSRSGAAGCPARRRSSSSRRSRSPSTSSCTSCAPPAAVAPRSSRPRDARAGRHRGRRLDDRGQGAGAERRRASR